jgi:HK97 family phage portal protein
MMAAAFTHRGQYPGSGGVYGPIGVPRQTTAGVRIDEERALAHSAAYAAALTYANIIAMMDKCVHQRKPDGNSEALPAHPVSRLLSMQPNTEITAFSLWRSLMINTVMGGDGFWEIERAGTQAVGLWPIVGKHVEKLRTQDDAAQLFYRVHNDRGAYADFPPEDIFHLPSMSFDGLGGLGLSRVGREALGLALGADQFQQTYLGNNAMPGGILVPDKKMTPEQRKEFEVQANGWWGGRKKHRLAVLPSNMEYKSISGSPHDALLNDTRTFQIREISRYTGVPSSFLSDMENTPYSKLEDDMRRFIMTAVVPYTRAISNEIDVKLLDGSGDLYYAFDMESLLRGDQQAFGDFLAKMFGVGAYTTNEVRQKLGENGIGRDGDKHMVATNLATLDTADLRSRKQGVASGGRKRGTPDDDGDGNHEGLATEGAEGTEGALRAGRASADGGLAPGGEEDTAGALCAGSVNASHSCPDVRVFVPVLADGIARVWRKEDRAAARKWEKLQDDSHAWRAWVDAFIGSPEHQSFVDACMRPALVGAGQLVDADADMVGRLVNDRVSEQVVISGRHLFQHPEAARDESLAPLMATSILEDLKQYAGTGEPVLAE